MTADREQLPSQNDSHDGYWDLLAWDDEEHADRPYVQIYSDAGCIAALYYTTPEEHELALEFARRLASLKAEFDRMKEAGRG